MPIDSSRVTLGVAFDGRNPVPRLVAQARAAEAAGADSFWVSSHLFLRDPFTMAAAALGATARARATLMAVSPHLVHPVHLAMAAATLDELAPGRVVLCLGTGAPGDLAGAAVTPERPIRALRESVEIARLLLAGERVRYRGELFRIEDRALVTGRRGVPIFVAASGPQALELAGAIADGVVLSTASSVEFVRWSLDHVDRGAKGRAVHRAGLVFTMSAAHEADALGRFRRNLAVTFRGPHHAMNLRLAGLTLDQDAVRRAVAAEDWATAESLVTDAIVRGHTATGTPEQVRERLARYRDAGLDELVLAGMYSPEETSQALRVARDQSRP